MGRADPAVSEVTGEIETGRARRPAQSLEHALANQQANENWLMKDFTDLPDQDWTHALENN